MIGIAQTGTGKTAAFVLPVLDEIADIRRKPNSKTCRTLILAPTRELAAQIAESVKTYGQNVQHSCAVVVGGVKPGRQVKAMARGLDVLVATPGRLLDHLQAGALRLDETTTVVLDEADQMLDMGFIPAIRKIMSALPADRQTLLFSATMPKQIKSLAKDFLNHPVEVSVAPESKPIERIDQSVILCERSEKTRLLKAYLLSQAIERAIIFTRTKYGADKLCRALDKAGLHASAIHGNKSQNQRKRALEAFKSGERAILVATDIAARGIDVSGVSHVVNFELPNVAESYVHRIGRTARAGESGVAVSLVSDDERGLLLDIEKITKLTLMRLKAEAQGEEVVLRELTAEELNERRFLPKSKPKQGGARSGDKADRSKRRRQPDRGKTPSAGPKKRKKKIAQSSENAQKKPAHRGRPGANARRGKKRTKSGPA